MFDRFPFLILSATFLAQTLCALFGILTGFTCQRGGVVVHSVVAGQPGLGEARRSELKRKAEKISRSYSEVFAMLTSGNSSQAEAARLLKTITNVTPVFVSAVRLLDKVFVFFQLKFSPADIPHSLTQVIANNG